MQNQRMTKQIETATMEGIGKKDYAKDWDIR